MKKAKSFIFLLVFTFILGSVVLAADNDFRNVNWGMTLDEVKQAEELKLSGKSKDSLKYKLDMYSWKTDLVYNFGLDGKLNNVFYNFFVIYANTLSDGLSYNENKMNQVAVDLYDNLKSELAQKYGTPQEDNVNWKNETYKSLPSSLGLHVANGRASLNTKWITDRTVILLTCSQGKRYGSWCANTRINYYEKSYYQSLQEQKPNPNLKNL